jgi:hypothetical protein
MKDPESQLAGDRPMVQSPFNTHTNMVRSGKIGWALLWLLGIPLPILLIIYAIMA